MELNENKLNHIVKETLNYTIRAIIRENIDEVEAYHGTKHDFDTFSTDFARSGEGANTQGYGVYVTLEKENVALHYAKIEQNSEHRHSTLFINGTPMKGSMKGGYIGWFREDYPNREGYNQYNNIQLTQEEQEEIYSAMVELNKIDDGCYVSELCDILSKEYQKLLPLHDELKMQLGSLYDNDIELEECLTKLMALRSRHFNTIDFDRIKTCLDILSKFNQDDYIELPNDKHFSQIVYTVEIPDITENDYLDWDGKIDQLKWNDEYINRYKNDGDYSPQEFKDCFTDYGCYKNTISNFYFWLAETCFDGSTKKASKYFYDHGYKGHYYGSNYSNPNLVIYNANDVKIIKKEKV